MRPLSSTQFIHWILLSRVNKSVGLLIKIQRFNSTRLFICNRVMVIQPIKSTKTGYVNLSQFSMAVFHRIHPFCNQQSRTFIEHVKKKNLPNSQYFQTLINA